MGVFGYSDAPPPQPNRAVAAEECIRVGFLIGIFADKLLPDASPGLTDVLSWGQGVILVPEVGANGGCHVDGGDEAEHAGDHQRCSKPVIHHGALGGNTGTREQLLEVQSDPSSDFSPLLPGPLRRCTPSFSYLLQSKEH